MGTRPGAGLVPQALPEVWAAPGERPEPHSSWRGRDKARLYGGAPGAEWESAGWNTLTPIFVLMCRTSLALCRFTVDTAG